MPGYIDLLTEEDMSFLYGGIRKDSLSTFLETISYWSTKDAQKRDLTLKEYKDAISLLIRKRNELIVKSFLNQCIQDILDDVSRAYDFYLIRKQTVTEALVAALSTSSLRKNVGIYYKLKNISQTRDYISTLQLQVDKYVEQRKNNQIKDETKVGESSANKKEAEQKALSQKTVEIEKELKNLQRNYDVLLSEHQKTLKTLSKYKILAEDFSHISSFVPEEGYEYTSLCMVFTDNNGRSRLQRLIDCRGGLYVSNFEDVYPQYTRLYRNDGPEQEGYIGLWDWRVIPSINDPNKPYFETKYKPGYSPIGIIKLQGITSLKEAIDYLKKGIVETLLFPSNIFCFSEGIRTKGIFCNEDVLTTNSGGKKMLRPEVLTLPTYDFINSQSIIQISSNGPAILKQTVLKDTESYVATRDRMELVRDRLVSKITWSTTQLQGFSRNEYKRIRDFIAGLPTTDFYDEICELYECNEAGAKGVINNLLKRADDIIDGNSIDQKIMYGLVKRNEDLYQECIESIRDEWIANNKEELAAAEEAVCAVKDQEEILSNNIKELEAAYQMLQLQVDEKKQEMTQAEQLADQVESVAKDRIQKAKENIAEFIVDQAFIEAGYCNSDGQIIKKSAGEGVALQNQHLTLGEVLNQDALDENATWKDVYNSIRDELMEAGVGEKYSAGLAALLYSAYIHHIPVLLAGANGMDIAYAFSMAVFGKSPTVFRCFGQIDMREYVAVKDIHDEIIVIDQLFSHEWYNNVLHLLEDRNRFYICLHPFYEDLAVEPSEILNYCIPIFTDLFVDTIPTRKYLGGYISEQFSPYKGTKPIRTYTSIMEEMNIRKTVKETFWLLIAEMRDMCEE